MDGVEAGGEARPAATSPRQFGGSLIAGGNGLALCRPTTYDPGIATQMQIKQKAVL
jgi:hypothetical protein